MLNVSAEGFSSLGFRTLQWAQSELTGLRLFIFFLKQCVAPSLHTQIHSSLLQLKPSSNLAAVYSSLNHILFALCRQWSPGVWKAGEHLQHLRARRTRNPTEACHCHHGQTSTMEYGHSQEIGMKEKKKKQSSQLISAPDKPQSTVK